MRNLADKPTKAEDEKVISRNRERLHWEELGGDSQLFSYSLAVKERTFSVVPPGGTIVSFAKLLYQESQRRETTRSSHSLGY